MRLPPQTPEEIDPVDQDNGLVQSDIGRCKRLANAVRFRDQIAIRQHYVDPSGMTPHFHRLVEIGQAKQHSAAIASGTDNHHTERLPSAAQRFRKSVLNDHDHASFQTRIPQPFLAIR